jgi:hypothetical protein
MVKDPKFDDIRPYYEEELPAAMQRIADSEVFPILADYVYPGEPIEKVRAKIRATKTIDEFQLDTMRRVNEQVIARSMTEFTGEGAENLDFTKNYLFVSNHRDIVLDACLLQYYLVNSGYHTTEITFGANLMMNPVIIDVGRSNKMFRVERPGTDIKEFYRASLHLSEYIRYAITEKGESVWIAQRNGRTKNGIDTTDQGIIKMFCMSETKDKIKALSELNIVPVTVSYEWEPCDVLKAVELYESQSARYVKKEGEDLNSILTGILQPKGHVHFQIGKPVAVEELEAYGAQTNNEYHKSVAHLLDSKIRAGYRLYPNNYIAHDILRGTSDNSDKYTAEQKQAFVSHLAALDKYTNCDRDSLRQIFLSIYANPVDNR